MEREQGTSFGELLKAFRKQKHIGQQQVAEQLAIHRNTVGAWERGDRLPDTRGTVLELAKCLQLDEQETARLLEASLTGVATRWNVPYRRNPFFTGREELMQRLHKLLRQEKAAALTQSLALSGLGGIGKTQLAVEYAYRYAQQYASVFWLNAETTESILASYAELALLLELPEQQEPDQQKVVAAVNRWLSTHRGWLLIVDNVEERELVASVLPTSPEGSLLFTTRRQSLGTLAYPLAVERMSQEEGTRFLLHRSRRLSLEEPLDHCSFAEVMEASRIVSAMEGLPLALDQAGAYIEETQCGLQRFFTLFQTHPITLLDVRQSYQDHPLSVMKTFMLAFEKIERASSSAADLLRLCTFLHPDAIPEELLITWMNAQSSLAESSAQSSFQFDQAIAALRAASLIQRHSETRTLTIHRLVQATQKALMNEIERQQWTEQVVYAINGLFPTVTFETWSQCERLLPHALEIVKHATVSEPKSDLATEISHILVKTAQYLTQRARHVEAESLLQRAIRLREQALGPKHLALAVPLQALGTIYTFQSKFEEAALLFQRALDIWEQEPEVNHPDLAGLLLGMAVLFNDQGKYGEGEQLCLRALSMLEESQEPDYSKIVSLLGTLAAVYGCRGSHEEAEQLLQRAVHLQEQTLGPDHPTLIIPLNNLALVYKEQGKYEEAEPLLLRALQIREQASGSEDPRIVPPLTNLADLYSLRGRWIRAERFYQRALSIWEQAMGSDDPNLAHPLTGLATLYRKQGKHIEAEPLFLRALALRERRLGAQHPETADVLYDFAALREAQGRAEEAAIFYQRALAIREHVFGPGRPLTRETREKYAAVLRKTGQQEEADALEVGLSEEVKMQ